MIDFSQKYDREVFVSFLKEDFLPSFNKDIRDVSTDSLKTITNAHYLGHCSELDLEVFEFGHTASNRKRVELTKEAFTILKRRSTFRALAAFYSEKTDSWRFSLLTATPTTNDRGGINTIFSNPKRYSFYLGPKAKIITPHKYLTGKGRIVSIEDLKTRFSIEVVNKEFYKKISKLFIELVGGQITEGQNKVTYKSILKLKNVLDMSQRAQEFAVRLIGRIIFCWFLREKHDGNIDPLMPKSIFSLEAVGSYKNYYHKILEPIFFELLNKPINSRDVEIINKDFEKIPYLNGGLFSPNEDDYYQFGRKKLDTSSPDVIVPDEWIENLFEVLETYNFTIDENTSFDEELSIDPEMLGRIFENLLAEINPETGDSARKSTGSFYTPRDIVNYMVDRSLFYHFKNNTRIDDNKLLSLISYNIDDDEEFPLLENEKIEIIKSLEQLRILDPACGSGAYPIGALQKIVFILQRVDPKGQQWFQAQIKNIPIELRKSLERENDERNFDYIRKLGVIKDNIFGIDIQPIATEISRLRCFLTLIVDQKVDDNKENRGIDPLPNLDFKFVTANSLISLPKIDENTGQKKIFEDEEGTGRLKVIREEYFTASIFDRSQLKERFYRLQRDMSLNNGSINNFADYTNSLITWDPFSHNSTSWFDKEWMFGVKGGFDIIIGNPPYIGQKGNNQLFKDVKRSELGLFHQRRMDYFYFFFHSALNLTNSNGVIAFITTNYYLTATYGDKLRSDLRNRSSIRELINFNELKIFESALGQHSIITILTKGYFEKIKLKCSFVNQGGIATSEILQDLFNNKSPHTVSSVISNKEIYDGKSLYIRMQSSEGDKTKDNNILEKMLGGSVPLNTVCDLVEGIHTGADVLSEKHKEKYNLNLNKGMGIFVLTKNEISAIGLNDDEKLLIKPWFKNSDINRWTSNEDSDKYLIYYTTKQNHKSVDNIRRYLAQFKKILINRKTRSGTGIISEKDYDEYVVGKKYISYVMNASAFKRGDYYCVSYPRKQSIFEGPKIIVPQRSLRNKFAYNEVAWYASADVYFIVSKNVEFNLKFILGLLNSDLFYYWLYHRGKRKGEVLELYIRPLSEIPIRQTQKSIQEPIIKIVDKIIDFSRSNNDIKVKEYEKELNSLVFDLYNITNEEIEIIKKEVLDLKG